MMDRNIEKFLEKVIKVIVEECQPRKIILFGSYAYGRTTEDSDIDLLIITQSPLKTEERYNLRYRFFGGSPLIVQLLSMTEEEFTETKDVVGGIAYPAFKYGRVLYEKS